MPGPPSTAPSHAVAMTCSFESPPRTSGTPARESRPRTKEIRSTGIAAAVPRRARAAVPPPTSPAQPIARKSNDLNTAWDHRWKSPASGPTSAGAAATAESMMPTWLTVDHASSRLRSLCAKARTAARSMVTETVMPRNQRAPGLATSSGNRPASTTVPAATMVAAWMSALAGVGPSIASASQSWKGTWADLPSTPMITRESSTARRVPSGAAHALSAASAVEPRGASLSRHAVGGAHAVSTPGRLVVPAPATSPMMPRTKPMSAKRVTRNALCAARRGPPRLDQ